MDTHFHFPAASTAMAFGMPINDAIERLNATARELDASAEQAPAGQSFGQKVALAVKRNVTRPRPAVFASATAVSACSGDKDFAKRLREAAEKKSGAKRHKEQAERGRERYEEQAERGRECPHP
jgi:hypothetical protein